MGLFDLFKGKDPLRHEEEGDKHFNAAAYGLAKLEYESALAKRRREFLGDIKIPLLEEKILRCREGLAREHKKYGDELVASGAFEDAQQFYTLALELTADSNLAGEIEHCTRDIEYRQAEKYQYSPSSTEEPMPEAATKYIPESYDEYATALFDTLPDDIRDIYTSYGERFQRGYVALNQGQFDAAAVDLSRALEENPEPESFVRLELASAYLNLKRFEEARILLEKFLAHNPDNLPACQILCEASWETKSYDRALTLLDSLSASHPESPDYCLLRGETLVRAGRIQQAESLYTEFLSDYGWDQGITRALAETCEAIGDLEKARDLYGKTIGLCSSCRVPADPKIRRKYADLCMETGIQNERILEIYLSLAEQDPANAAGYYQNISRIYAALGHEKESTRYQRIALGYE